mmetsp:Transcript_70446/g.165987  ORF Transcript_70446/g.165987 Transcript_70446/m.165987 type:complete len:229 (+) Transcript_70446:978-1664(+)
MLQEFIRSGQLQISPPALNLRARTEIAPGRNGRGHAGGAAGHHVPYVIAHVEAGLGLDIQTLRGLQEGRGVRLGMAGRVSSDNHLCTQPESSHQWQRKALGLVRHDAPAQTGIGQAVQHGPDAFERLGAVVHECLVTVEELPLEFVVVAMPRRDLEALGQHAARARAAVRPKHSQGQWIEAASTAHLVHCGSQVRRTVDQRAVQVEQDGAQVPPVRVDVHSARRQATM